MKPSTETGRYYRSQVSGVYGVAPESVTLVNEEFFIGGHERYLLGYLRNFGTQRRNGFFKLTPSGGDARDILQREARATQLASSVGIPTVSVLAGFQETSDGHGVVLFSRLSSQHGALISGKSELHRHSPLLGSRAAHAYVDYALPEVPVSLESAFLQRDDRRNYSIDACMQVWDSAVCTVQQRAKDWAVKGQIRAIDLVLAEAESARKVVHQAVADNAQDTKEYFVHNDMAPSNMYFWHKPHTGRNVLFLDFERAGAVKNMALAHITEMSDFYRSCGTNNEMRMEFIKAFLRYSNPNQIRLNYLLAKGAMIFGTLIHAGSEQRNRLDPSHHEYTETINLLSSLPQNLHRLERV